ncbi:pyridoxal phosphate-dependent aminotransferase [Sulfobacillus thermosulfidooxidans]|uniref:pyridoxal phosphate-dependent aminotransferase n=1 Tax=Sulfobacillus thermosulfidooxidans TaxID=28034 RepID=UPI0006B53260|nr:aminotransferase class I/II-fold pyridoxal phosphate-dependent enzyme [Sulfobacillus thermosulfidooxidans]
MHGGDWAIYDATTWAEKNFLDLSSSISPYGPGPRARLLWPSLIDRLDRYPDWRKSQVSEQLARHLRVDTRNLIVTAGAMEAIELLFQAYHPHHVLIKIPAFSEYETRALLHGQNVSYVTGPKDLSSGPGMLFIANPANPTGHLLSEKDLQQYKEWAYGHGHIMVVDEAFIEFVENWHHHSVMQEAIQSDHLVVLGSLTKFYGLAGLRIGFLVGQEDVIAKISQHTYSWHVSLVAQEMAVASLHDQTYFELTRSWIHKEKQRLQDLLQPFGRVDDAAQANYFLLFPKLQSCDDIIKGLITQGILVRDARTFKGLDQPAIRIAVKRPKDSDRLVKALSAIYGITR